MASLTLVFMGTPSFALPTFHALLSAGHRIAAAYTQPPRPAGRGQRERISPVHAAALERGIPVRTPRSLKHPDEQTSFAALGADAAVVVAYGLILPKPILEAPRLGCLNLHASLLPRWRGAAPIQRAIMAGDSESGVTIMQMDEGLDTGPMLLQLRVPTAPGMTAGELHDLLADRGAPLMVDALAGLAAGRLRGQAQPATGVTYAPKIDKGETGVDWRLPAAELDRRIRGLSPSPGAWFALGGTRIKVLRAAPLPDEHGAPPGQVLDDRLAVACGEGALRLLELQRAGKGSMDAGAFLRGFPVPAGSRLG